MGDKPETGDVFDIERLRRLVELMERHDLREVELRQGEQSIQLKRGQQAAAPVALAPAPAPVAAAPAAASVAAPAAPAEEPGRFVYIESPMVGTFYSKANPEAAPFVKVGDRVNSDSTVCIIEAMKVFNEIAAECSGVVAAVLVENEEAVEFGKKLFKIDTKA
ncbi:MAG: acetyl-CoA carboxylase biotin carboxyl carrier protein [Planctomycetales bacterium]|nr:acetyl-CoA carboxylase biotin carboxyl carrier protein [Planctomycetales bacterium]